MLLVLSASCVFFFAASCLSASNLQLAFDLTDERQLSRSAASLLLPYLMADSRLCKLSLQLIFVTLSWSTTIALSFLELAEEDCFGHAYVFHACDIVSPAQLHLKRDGLYAGQAGSLGDFFVRHVVLPFDAKDGAQAALVKPLQ